MAAGMYNAGKLALMGGDIDLINSQVGCLLIDVRLYAPSFGEDLSLDDIPVAAIISEVTLTGKTLSPVEITGEFFTVFRADSAVFPSVGGDDLEVGAVVVFLQSDTFSGSTLILFNDEAPEFPAIPDGEDFTVNWDAGNNGILRF